eukprot:358100_1
MDTLSDLWQINQLDRVKGLKLLSKIFMKILKEPSEEKYANLNLQKIKQKFMKCTPCFDLLLIAGFKISSDNTRLKWIHNANTMKLLKTVNISIKYYFTANYRDIIDRLLNLEFDISDIVYAIDNVKNKNDIHEIVEYITMNNN